MLALDFLDKTPSEFLSLRGGNYAQWRVRPNGQFEYFPMGMRKPGYCVDSETRDRIIRLARGLNSFDYTVFSAVIMMMLFAGNVLSRLFPAGGLLVWPVTLFAGVIILIAVQRVSDRGAVRMRSELLRQAPVVQVSEIEYRETMVRRLEGAPKRRIVQNFVFVLLMLILGAASVMAELEYTTAWLGIVAAILGVVVAAGFAQMAIDILRVHRWRRTSGRRTD
jgi:hypothetical protein